MSNENQTMRTPEHPPVIVRAVLQRLWSVDKSPVMEQTHDDKFRLHNIYSDVSPVTIAKITLTYLSMMHDNYGVFTDTDFAAVTADLSDFAFYFQQTIDEAKKSHA